MTTPAKKADHYLPAALIGLFGVPSTKPGQAALRYASVSVRFHAEPGQVKELRADAVAKGIGEYWIDNPPPGVPPNFVDTLWDYESLLPVSIRRFETGTWAAEDWGVVRKHLAATGVRHPEFAQVAEEYGASRGRPIRDRDDVQAERVNTLVNSAPLLAGGRFALVRAPDDGRRFVINDKGFAKVSDGKAGGILFQLSGKVAILCVPEVGPVPGRDHAWLCDEMTLTADAVFPWNDATWRHTGPYCVIGHPDDADSIGVLGDLAVVIPDVPFRDRSDSGMFDWAFEGSASSGLRGTAAP